jgi:hypothetical protein
LRRRWTALVVGAVAAIAVLGITDAIRSNAEEPGRVSAPTTTRGEPAPSEPPAVAQELETRGIGGLLYAAVRRAGRCRLDVIALPTLNRSSLFELGSCRIEISPTGRVATGGACSARRSARFGAQSRAGLVAFRGCAPAWRPGGGLTYVNPRGDVIELVEPCGSKRRCLRVVVPRSEIPKAARELTWVDEDRLAVLVGGRYRLDRSFAIFDAGRLVARSDPCCPVREYVRVVGGRLLAPQGRPPTGIVGFDAAGRLATRQALPPYLADGGAFSVSPDGLWVASTLGDRVHIYRVGVERPLDPVALDLAAVDLGWVG